MGLVLRGAPEDEQPGAWGAQQVGGDLGADAAEASGEQGEAVVRGRLGAGRAVGQRGEAAFVAQPVPVRHVRAVRADGRLRRQEGQRVGAVAR